VERRRPMAETDAGDGRRADRSRLVDLPMDQPTSRATELGHDRTVGRLREPEQPTPRAPRTPKGQPDGPDARHPPRPYHCARRRSLGRTPGTPPPLAPLAGDGEPRPLR